MKRFFVAIIILVVAVATGCSKADKYQQSTLSDVSAETESKQESIKHGTVTQIESQSLCISGEVTDWGDTVCWVVTSEETVFAYENGMTANFDDIEVGMELEFSFVNGYMQLMSPPTAFGCVKIILPNE